MNANGKRRRGDSESTLNGLEENMPTPECDLPTALTICPGDLASDSLSGPAKPEIDEETRAIRRTLVDSWENDCDAIHTGMGNVEELWGHADRAELLKIVCENLFNDTSSLLELVGQLDGMGVMDEQTCAGPEQVLAPELCMIHHCGGNCAGSSASGVYVPENEWTRLWKIMNERENDAWWRSWDVLYKRCLSLRLVCAKALRMLLVVRNPEKFSQASLGAR
jgi:hypothetical protein